MDDELAQLREKRRAELESQRNGTGAPTRPVEVNQDTLGALLENHPIAMVDVWAAWCGPCRMMEPIVEELAHEWKGRAIVTKLNADANPDFLAQYGVQGIPTFLFFKDGTFVGRLVGARPKQDFEAALKEVEAATPDPATV